MNRKTVRNLFLTVIIVSILLSTMIIADLNYVLKNQKPVFCFIKNTYEDGGTIEYVGFGYKIINYNATYGRQDVVFGSIFKAYDPQIDKSKFEENKDNKDNKNKIYDFSGKVQKIEVINGKTILTVLSKDDKKQNIKVIDATLIYENDYKAKLTDIVVGSEIEVRTSNVDSTKEIPESIAEIINIRN